MRRKLLCTYLGFAVLSAATSTPNAQLGQPQLPEVDWEQKLGSQIPLETRFENSLGGSVLLSELVGERPFVLALVYFECPMLCDMVLSGLVSSMRSLEFDAGDEFDVVVISIDPDESVELARTQRDGFLERYGRDGADAGWHFLIAGPENDGGQESIDAIADAVGYRYTFVPETDEFAHAAGIAILTAEGRVARILYGNEFASRDLKFSLIEAADGRIGSPVDKFLLRCFHYDPTKGEYGFAIMTTLRVAGTLTVAILAFVIGRVILRDRRRTLGVPTEEGGARAT